MSKPRINKETVEWLTQCPPSDQNFKSHLATATMADCEEALKWELSKAAITAIEARMKRLFRETQDAKASVPANTLGEEIASRIQSKALVPNGRKPLTLATLATLPPVVGNEDAEMGRQLTEQWERVKSGIRDQVVMGAMMLKVRERVGGVSACGHSGDGLKGWLQKFAPDVSRSVAYSLMKIAEGVREAFALKKVDLEALLTAQLDGMDAKLAKKRAAIEEVIEGKSQRQLLLEFGHQEAKSRGGHHPRQRPPDAPVPFEEQIEIFNRTCRDDFMRLFTEFDRMLDQDLWMAPSITDDERELAAERAEKFFGRVKVLLKLPKNRRARPAFMDAIAKERAALEDAKGASH